MPRCITIATAVIGWSVASGCDNTPDMNLAPIMVPVDSRDDDANLFRNWQSTDEQLASLATMKANCHGPLASMLDHAKWSGHRLRVTGTKDGFPVTENVGPWHLILVPTSDATVVEIRGLLFANQFSVKLDLARDVLIVNDAEFEGRHISGKSPMFQDAGFDGIAFERRLGLVMGWAGIYFLDDGRLAMDFHKILVNGVRAGEYGVLKGATLDK